MDIRDEVTVMDHFEISDKNFSYVSGKGIPKRKPLFLEFGFCIDPGRRTQKGVIGGALKILQCIFLLVHDVETAV